MIEQGASTYHASWVLNLPYQTIQDRVTGRVPWGARWGGHNKCLTTAEENHLVLFAKDMCNRGLPISLSALTEEVAYVLKAEDRATPFKDGKPGRKWVSGFLKRNPELTRRVTQLASRQRFEVSEERLQEWYADVQTYFDMDEDLAQAIKDPSRIFNMDETAFAMEGRMGRKQRVLVPTGSESNYALKPGSRKTITFTATICANGCTTKPFIIYPGKRLTNINAEGFPGCRHWVQKNGWTDGPAFLQYLQGFQQDTQAIKRPVILFLDNYISHCFGPAL